MGKLHPHGDTAIYDALVRMAQAFTLRVPLVDGHGNFGSLDDGPAPPRYTEARLASRARDDRGTRRGRRRLRAELRQPAHAARRAARRLPEPARERRERHRRGHGHEHGAAQPHRGRRAARHLLAHPNATLDELMEFVPGPDLPTGGTIVGLAGIKDAYATGRGSFKTRAKVSVESITARKTGLGRSPNCPTSSAREGHREDQGRRQRQEDQRHLRRHRPHRSHRTACARHRHQDRASAPTAVLEQLYPARRRSRTRSTSTTSRSSTAARRRSGCASSAGLRRAPHLGRSRGGRSSGSRAAGERLHLVEGLLIAILDIDEVIQVIRTSDEAEQARTPPDGRLRPQPGAGEYILELRLRRLTRFSRIELEAERDKLRAEIEELELLLASRHRIEALVSDELAEVAERYGTPRRTLLTDARPSIAGAAAKRAAAVLEVADVPCRVFLSATGRIARVDLPEGPDGPPTISPPARRSKHDAIRSTLDTTSRAEIGAVTSLGRLIRFTPVDLPMLPPTSVQLGAGVRIGDYLALPNRDEKVLAIVSLDTDRSIAIGTKQGVVKRVATGAYPNKPEFEVIGLKAGDEVVGAVQGDEGDELVFVASDAQLLRFAAASVRPQGCPAGGMAGINLGTGAHVIHFTSVPADAASDTVVVTIAANSETLLGTDPGSAR
jgi:DNA gyrase subunit A